jgi:regulator of sigma E protease
MDWIIGLVLVLGVMILVHEWGHFIVARLFGVRVDVFSIGFGPRLFGWKRGATDYRISALPLGGYVRMAGQDPSEIDSPNRDWVHMKSAASDKSRPEQSSGATSKAAEFRGVDQPLRLGTGAPDELMSKPRWQRALISFAGPAVNLIFPLFLLSGFFLLVGVPYPKYLTLPAQIQALPTSSSAGLKPGDRLLSVDGTNTATWEEALRALKQAENKSAIAVEVDSQGSKRSFEIPLQRKSLESTFGYLPIPPVIDQVVGDTPASKAGLHDDDKIVAVDGQKITLWGEFVDRVRNSGGKAIALEVERKGQRIHTSVTPKLGPTEDGDNIYQIGVSRFEETSYRHVGLREGTELAGSWTLEIARRTLDIVGRLFSGRVSISQLQGPVGISHEAKRAVDRGPVAVISLMVLISINLGILNLLPIPILDGGNILLLAIEGGLRRDLSMAFKERYVQIGLVFLLVIFAIVMYHDVLRRLPAHS